MVRMIQVIPRDGVRLYGAMVRKEVDFAQRNRGTFFRSGRKKRDQAKWSHSKYSGWINLSRGMGEVVLAEIHSKSTNEDAWQILSAFLGWLDRYFAAEVQAVNIQYSD